MLLVFGIISALIVGV
ncbi:hypothetical protein M3J56_26085, partial [Enterobacter hormaechei]|nr:hypothetical protein [Enterobacter hormaechei]